MRKRRVGWLLAGAVMLVGAAAYAQLYGLPLSESARPLPAGAGYVQVGAWGDDDDLLGGLRFGWAVGGRLRLFADVGGGDIRYAAEEYVVYPEDTETAAAVQIGFVYALPVSYAWEYRGAGWALRAAGFYPMLSHGNLYGGSAGLLASLPVACLNGLELCAGVEGVYMRRDDAIWDLSEESTQFRATLGLLYALNDRASVYAEAAYREESVTLGGGWRWTFGGVDGTLRYPDWHPPREAPRPETETPERKPKPLQPVPETEPEAQPADPEGVPEDDASPEIPGTPEGEELPEAPVQDS